jgi:hypothetical protein
VKKELTQAKAEVEARLKQAEEVEARWKQAEEAAKQKPAAEAKVSPPSPPSPPTLVFMCVVYLLRGLV